MSDLERLIEIARGLPPQKVHALLSVAEQMLPVATDEEFFRKLDAQPSVDVDDQTANELREGLADLGETVSHGEMKRQLGLP
jgi:hypothetical protein